MFFAFILDAHSRRIVGWQFAGHMRTELVLDAFGMAIHQRGHAPTSSSFTIAIAAVNASSTGRRNTVLFGDYVETPGSCC